MRLAGWGQWLIGRKGSEESAHLKITPSVHLVCRTADESEAGPELLPDGWCGLPGVGSWY